MSISTRLAEITAETNVERARALLANEGPSLAWVLKKAASAKTAAEVQTEIDAFELIGDMLAAFKAKLP